MVVKVVDMEEGDNGKWGRMKMKKRIIIEELKKVGSIAVPMVVVTMLQYLLQVVSLMMVGHLGKLSLSSVALATSLTNVSGFGILVSSYFSQHLISLPFSCITNCKVSFIFEFDFNLTLLSYLYLLRLSFHFKTNCLLEE
ncbi:hypothetical protein Lalb_Chr04g0257701 [Lupinus albus]|uniref:Multi antimicrobial extrusion protein n=1 Tax=Lupinus albus TaxID=3870 RepID=A0A6A4QNR5_LUPAL|nr:hypothetical protein Lalb_Chr04g0257701 [Lupinus albus]